ncbi:hypothetical protein LshimejAT787_0111510 [Lyophyllum shimeji]|uniref:DUF5745 domain-containing protein n=1 Tax=Lyophyllum shimeji TaxID=47721 RepID=A0A9P3PE68_LYOSH|nr:hypothetical protein LshimejAT787_0111510 [Lyophyllum shimeji]
MSARPESTNYEALVRQLNTLLDALHIPISLESPTELTPSLLIAILESLLSMRLPKEDRLQTREAINLQNTKLFLGILETDVLQVDVGLSNLDPRRLANGELEECVYIAELLCWIGRRLGHIVAEDPFELDDEPPSRALNTGSYSPSTSTTATRNTFTTSTFSTTHRRSDSNTSVESFRPSTPIRKSTPQHRSPPFRSKPRCIHEVPTPSVILSPNLDSSFAAAPSLRDCPDSPAPPSSPNVRYTGYISPVDEELELLSFEHSRSMSSRKIRDDSNSDQAELSYSLQALRESRARTLALYQERARLLEELARLESQQLRRPER